MELIYHGTNLHDLGRIIIRERSARAVEGQAALPQSMQHRLVVHIAFYDGPPSFADRFALAREVERVLRTKNGVLLWRDENGQELLNQPVMLEGPDWPGDPNADHGAFLQELSLVFTYYENIDAARSGAQAGSFQRAGASAPVSLGQVTGVKETKEVTRYSPHHPHRASSFTRQVIRGRLAPAPQLSAADQRAWLRAALAGLRDQITSGASGTLTYGGQARVVKVESFEADADQEAWHVWYSLNAVSTDFPNESNYAQCVFSVTPREDLAEGKHTLTLAGEILAHSEAAALAKLALLRTAHGAGYTRIESEPTRERIDGADGAAFIKLTFRDLFEKSSGGLRAWRMVVSDAEEMTGGALRRAYTGFVEAASAASWLAAYQLAVTKARALGDHRHALPVAAAISCTDHQQSADRTVTGDYTARVEFAFEYRLRGAGRVYLEVTGQLQRETFGLDTETVSGVIVAADHGAAAAVYDVIRAGYPRVRNETFTEERVKMAKDAGAPAPGAAANVQSPPAIGAIPPGVSVNAGEALDTTAETTTLGKLPALPALGANYARQPGRFSFSFQVHRAKAAGAENVTLKYRLDTQKDFTRNEKVSSISDGVILAADEAAAENYLNDFLPALGLGAPLQLRLSRERERYAGAGDTFLAFSFSTEFAAALSAEGAVLECSLTETIRLSGARLAVQATAIGSAVLQGRNGELGRQHGERVIEAEVVATNETTARGWLKRQRLLPLPDTGAFSGWAASAPAEVSFTPVTLPLVSGVMRTGNYGAGVEAGNAHLVRARLRLTQVFEDLSMEV